MLDFSTETSAYGYPVSVQSRSVLNKPPLGPEFVGILAPNLFVTMKNPRVDRQRGTLRKVQVTKLYAALWCKAR